MWDWPNLGRMGGDCLYCVLCNGFHILSSLLYFIIDIWFLTLFTCPPLNLPRRAAGCGPVDLVISDSVWFLFDLGWCIYIQSKWFSGEMMDWHFTTLRFSHEHPWTNSKGYGRKTRIPAFLSQCGIIIIIWIKIPGSQSQSSEIILTL